MYLSETSLSRMAEADNASCASEVYSKTIERNRVIAYMSIPEDFNGRNVPLSAPPLANSISVICE